MEVPADTEVGPTRVTELSVAAARVIAPVPAFTSRQSMVMPMYGTADAKAVKKSAAVSIVEVMDVLPA